MSTSDPNPETPGPATSETLVNVWTDGAQVPAGLPDPAVLARMANDFFRASPGVPQAGALPIVSGPTREASSASASPGAGSLANYQSTSGPTARPDVTVPTEAELRAIPATLTDFSIPSVPTAAATATPSAVAGS